MIKECVDLVKLYEGCRLEAYIDPVGVWTIGYGHTAGVKPGMVITQKEAEEMLSQELDIFAMNVQKLVKVPITEYQLGALTSFAYNVGIGNLKSSTLLKKLNNNDIQGAADEFRKWNKAGGKVLNGLVRRREAERELFLKGSDNMVQTFSLKQNGNALVSKNFKVKEFKCKDGSDEILIDVDFVRNYLQKIRDHFNVPVTINSAYRTPTYNTKIGGAKNSYHMKGRAFDIVPKGIPLDDVAQYSQDIGVKGVIRYNTFVHVDSRETPYYALNNNGKVTTVSKFM